MKISCQKCPERATLHITELNDDGYVEVHLCFKCAQKYLNEAEQRSESEKMAAAGDASVDEAVNAITCPVCKTTFGQFRSTGRLGCAHDYEVFCEQLSPLLDNIHEAARHIGKMPKRLPMYAQQHTKLIQLRQELQKAVALEDYEQAARVRDQIDTLQRES